MAIQLFSSVRRHIVIFLLVVIVCGGGGAGITYVIPPLYQAEASIVANFNETDQSSDSKYNDILVNQMLMQTYEGVVKSHSIAKVAKDKLKSSESPKDLLGQIEVKSNPGTLILTIYARYNNPRSAVDIANAFAEAFVENGPSIVKNANITILDKAVYENSLNSVRPKLFIVAASVFMGIILGLSFSLLLEKKKLKKSLKKSYNIPATLKREMA